MNLKQTNEFLKEGIEMRKMIHAPIYGFFTSSKAVYEYDIIYDLEKAVEMSNKCWEYVKGMCWLYSNLALFMYRDLKANEEKPATKSKGKRD